ncbi:MAG: hypothetical protein ABR591_10910 [Candidatus Velthaea sp.]
MLRVLLVVSALAAGTSGCASSVAGWIVQTRNHQGDVALRHGNLADASLAYQLALKLDAANEHARAGLVGVQLQLAQSQFTLSRFEDALASLAIATKYSPNDERITAVRSDIEQAQIKRDIVVSNYPAYGETGFSILRAYNRVKTDTDHIELALRRFNYTYDTNQLTAAIRGSYELNAEITRYTSRLVQFRQLVESGVPETAKGNENLAPPASLLPLP